MLMLLCQNDLWEYVSGSIPTADIRTVAWRKGDAKALGTIALGLDWSTELFHGSSTPLVLKPPRLPTTFSDLPKA